MIQNIKAKAPGGFAQVTLFRDRFQSEIDEYDLLIEAICRQAAKDLRGKSLRYRIDAMDFFRSEWFEFLTGLDGEEILQQLLDE